ncbi:hypothetical protein B0H13DRAFT_542756 [Mycena leptocephala]|nr:hypothetical protein B0H13DRAFT_542756 [Mycena leptocephala]
MDTQKFETPNNELEISNQGTLRRLTSYSTGRYENRNLVSPFVMEISPGLFATFKEPEPAYLGPRWTAWIDPEGQLYFFREGPLRVVTEAYLYRPDIMENLCRWIEHIESLLSDAEMTISKDIELFLELEGENCAYYFVDHATCAQFWMESLETDQLGLPPVVSTSHLKIVLEELYWVHVEHFPMHLRGLPTQKLDEVLSIFYHGLCDQMTSRVSTFLYTTTECKDFVNILQGCRGNMDNGHTTWIIARLWSVINHNKYLTYYGQENSRLSRDQSILFDPEQKHRWISKVMAYLTFKTSRTHLARLDDVFVDHIVYADRWAQLVGDCLKQWRATASGAFAGLVLHLPFLLLNSPSPALLTASAALFSSSLGSSILLEHRYEPMEGLSATDAMDYLESIQSPIFKFQLVAFAFSLPKALLLWGCLVLLANCLLLVAKYFGLRLALVFAVLSLLVISALYGTTSATLRPSWAKFMGIFRRKSEDAAIQMV